MKKFVQLLMLVLVVTQFYCEKMSSQNISDKVLFALYTEPRDSDSLIDVFFETHDTLDEKPSITIGGFLPDSIYDKEGFYRAMFRKYRCGSIITYKIKLYGDSIVDQIIVPGEIDSLFCNNRYIFGNYKDSTIYIDTASTYLFTWKTKQKGDFFQLEYYGDLNNNRDFTKFFITTDTFFTITPEIKGLSHSFLKFKLENHQGNNGSSVPNISSNKMELYYQIWAPRYVCHIYME